MSSPSDSTVSPLIPKNDFILELDKIKIICRSSDNRVNLSELCKAGNKLFSEWKRNKKTSAFLEALSTSLEISKDVLMVYESGSNENRATWGHLQIAINIAQWISPEFDVKVTKWIYEFASTGKLESGNEKSQNEIDDSWKNKICELETELDEKNKLLQEQAHDIRLKDKQLYALKRRHKSVLSEFKHQAGFYIISDAYQNLCDKDCKRPTRFKVGLDTVNVARRLDQHRTTIPSLQINFLVYLNIMDCKLLEESMLRKYEQNRFPYLNHEWIFDVPVDSIINSAKHMIKYMRMENEVDERTTNYNKETAYCLSLREDDEHEQIERKIDEVSDKVNNQEMKQQEIDEVSDKVNNQEMKQQEIDEVSDKVNIQEMKQQEITEKLEDIQQKIKELDSIRTDMISYKLRDLRQKLEFFGLSSSGSKSYVIKRLRDHVELSIQQLISKVPAIHLEAINNKEPEIAPTKEPEKLKQYTRCNEVRPITSFGMLKRTKDGYRPCCKMCHESRVNGTWKCVDCDGDISGRSTRCISCSAKFTKNRTHPNKPTKEELEKMLSEMLQKDVAEKLGVNKTTLIRWKKDYGLACK